MSDTTTNLPEFRVEIAREWFQAADWQITERIVAVLSNITLGHAWVTVAFCSSTYLYHGRAPREVVTLLMAMAQGHNVIPALIAAEQAMTREAS